MDIWERMGSEKSELVSIISDQYKSVNGCRPRGYNWEAFTMPELNAWLNNLNDEVEAMLESEAAEEMRLEKEHRARLQEIIDMGAGNIKTALKWMYGNETYYNSQCVQQVIWREGLLFTDYGQKLVNVLKNLVTYK